MSDKLQAKFIIEATDVKQTVGGAPWDMRALTLHKVARVLDLLTGREHNIALKHYGALAEYQCSCDDWRPGATHPVGCVHSVFFEQHIDEIKQAPQSVEINIAMTYHRADWLASAATVLLSVINEEKASDQ